MTSPRWLTPADIARRLQISRSSAFALVRKLPRYQEGRITRVSEEDFAAYLAANMITPGEVDARTLERRRQASIAALAYHERQRAEATAKAKRKADARAAAALVTKPAAAARGELSDRTVERLTRPTKPRASRPYYLPRASPTDEPKIRLTLPRTRKPLVEPKK